ncbi:type IV pilin N-terminal domain-containing protein [Methanorbis furvi]|uniref:Archaeal Type IV pilin N-terminal domain-containing protein n=1 Tax=Methanorbis furvi TaxID=3028299 RepID=A0AAE4MCB3_9EURY|nr:hypothetical protein [Methanocorpusculaceae archaeon Ag1]
MTRDSAVSPVVGVMLLLVLVIIFTAVLAAYAGGLAQTSTPSPSVDIVAYSSGSGGDFSIIFEHRGSDALPIADCKITTFIDSHESSFPASVVSESSSWRTGEIVSTKNLTNTASLLKISESQFVQYIKRSTPLELRLYHLPTNSILFKDTILLEEP